jgi:hypothetical protein
MRNDDFDDMQQIDRWLVRLLAAIVLIVGCGLIWSEARAHDWFPPNCCSGFDCKVIPQSQVKASKNGFVIPGNPEVVPYSSPKIRQTPPEGDGNFALCTKGGKPDGAVICLYIPTWGS